MRLPHLVTIEREINDKFEIVQDNVKANIQELDTAVDYEDGVISGRGYIGFFHRKADIIEGDHVTDKDTDTVYVCIRVADYTRQATSIRYKEVILKDGDFNAVDTGIGI